MSQPNHSQQINVKIFLENKIIALTFFLFW